MRRLTRAPNSSLILIVAPPGYGKSTLLSQWAEQEQRMFVRVSLGRSPGSASKLIVEAVAGALRDAGCPGVARRIPASRRGLERLSSSIRLLGADVGSFVLALDDAETVEPAALRDIVTTALDALTGDSAVAVASRTEPPLARGGLRARRELTEIRASDLAVTPTEAAPLLRRAGLSIDRDAVRDLVGRTEGWPAGLYLAALSIQDQADVSTALEQFGGDDHRVAEFLHDEVMSGLRPDLARFAVSSSMLKELEGPVCDAVLERTESAATLSELAAANPFLRPVDLAHERFRWHPMLRQALASELRRSMPKLGRTLHRRAAEWFCQQGDTDSAIDHAVSAGDPERTADLLWANLVGYLGSGRSDLVQRWLSRFTQSELSGSAPLALSSAYAHLMTGHLDQARYWSTVATAVRERTGANREAPSLAAGLSVIEAALSRQAAETGRIAARACELEPQDSPWRPMCLLLRGAALHLTGEPKQARQWLESAAELAEVAVPVVAALGLAHSAMIALEEKDWESAADLADRTERLIEQHGLMDCPVSALAFAACAASRAHEGRTDEAKRDLRSGIDLLARLGEFIPWYGAEARILLALASLRLADVVGARSLLADASRLARRTPDAIIFEQWFDEAWSNMDSLAETRLAGPSSLTIAELRVLRFLPSHRSFREIGAQLGVSANTVKTQAHAVYRKLGAASRSEAVARAAEAGLLGQ